MSLLERVIKWLALLIVIPLIIFVAGFVFREQRISPTPDILVLKSQFQQYLATGLWGKVDEFPQAPLPEVDAPIRVVKPEAFLPGYRLIQGADPEVKYSVRLVDETGKVIHKWPLLESIATSAHGLEVLPDGSVVFVASGGDGAMARVDQCGQPIWHLKGRYHHQVHLADDGTLWTWYSPDHHNGHIQEMVQVDPDTGETLKSVSLNDVANASRENAMILRIPDNFEFVPKNQVPRGIIGDIWHPNDVEPLSPALAGQFENFEAGDLLISLHTIDLVAVIDPDTLEFKWWQSGPWQRQHDPDFLEDGTIEIYDNAFFMGRSSIVTIDPDTGEMWRRHPEESPHWYSKTQGLHERLPNGNSLITVPWEGRVIELDEAGDMVFEFRMMMTDTVRGRSSNALWVPLDYFDEVPNCAG